MSAEIIHGDCLDVMRGMAAGSVDTIITDPPAGVSFMGKTWDGNKGGREQWVAWLAEIMAEGLRVLKPGGFALVWALPRTSHWTALALEDAGFEVRDCIYHLFGSGFPKSLDIGKAIDRRGGNPHLAAKIGQALKGARVARGLTVGECDKRFCGGTTNWTWFEGRPVGQRAPTPATFSTIAEAWPEVAHLADMVAEAEREVTGKSPNGFGPNRGASLTHALAAHPDITAPATPLARAFHGYGTALKPAAEVWWVAMKPTDGTFAQNAAEHGVAGLWIDGARVGNEERPRLEAGFIRRGRTDEEVFGTGYGRPKEIHGTVSGRWPANLVLDEEAGRLLDEMSGERKSGEYRKQSRKRKGFMLSGSENNVQEANAPDSYGDTGGASRFFYVAKASRAERNAGLEGMEERGRTFGHKRCAKCGKQKVNVPGSACVCPAPEWVAVEDYAPRANHHPTVKPVALMRWLARLTRPPHGGTVLDPFAGSGSTGVACIMEGRRFIGIEREAEYVEIARARLDHATQQAQQLPLAVGAD